MQIGMLPSRAIYSSFKTSTSSYKNTDNQNPSFCGYKYKKYGQRPYKQVISFVAGFMTCFCVLKAPILHNESKIVKNIEKPLIKVVEDVKEFKLKKFNLDHFTDYFKKSDVKDEVEKTAEKTVNDTGKTSSNVKENVKASVAEEIKALKNVSYTEKNKRLYKLYKTGEVNPELKNYLLSCRMDYLNKKMDTEWAGLINEFCEKYQITSTKAKVGIFSQMLQESALNPTAGSNKGAYGLMQIIPSTAEAMNKMYVGSKDKLISFDCVKDPRDVSDNIEIGVALMADNLRRYRNCEDPFKTALASYNAGTGPVDAYLKGQTLKAGNDYINTEKVKIRHGIPPYEETTLYVNIIEDTKNYMLKNLENLDSNLKQRLDIQ